MPTFSDQCHLIYNTTYCHIAVGNFPLLRGRILDTSSRAVDRLYVEAVLYVFTGYGAVYIVISGSSTYQERQRRHATNYKTSGGSVSVYSRYLGQFASKVIEHITGY